MAAPKNKKKKKWLVPVIVVAVVAVFLFVGLSQYSAMNNQVAATDITRTATVETGSIQATVVGSGTMAAEGTADIKIPYGLEVESVEVEAGDVVQAGDVLATLDPDVLQSAILDAQGDLADIDTQIEDVKDESGQETVKSSVSGRVKQIFVQAGDDTADVIRRDGSLMVLSIDGTMKVTFEGGSGLKVGDGVTVALADDSKKDGEVVKVADGQCTVTLTDNGPEYGENVTVQDKDGNKVGSGTLEITTPLKVYASDGVVKSVDVEENDKVSTSTKLLTLTQSASNEYDTLLNERAQYEKVLDTLLVYAQTNTVNAEVAGTVSNVALTASNGSGDGSTGSDGSSAADMASKYGISYSYNNGREDGGAQLLGYSENSKAKSALGQGFTLLSNEESGDTLVPQEESGDAPTLQEDGGGAATVTDITGTVEVYINNPVTGNTPQTTIMPGAGYTGTLVWDPPVTKFEANNVYTAAVILKAGAGYHFAADAVPHVAGAMVGGTTVSAEAEGNTLTFMAVFPPTQAAATGGTTGGTGQYDASALQQAQAQALAQQSSNSYSSSSLAGLTGGSGSYSGYTGSDSSSSAYSASETSLWQTAFSVESGSATSLTVSIDELDILSLKEGQEATVALDALPGQPFTGVVTKLSAAGTSQSGVTTYPVTLRVSGEGVEQLMAGMNATATIVTATSENILVIPLAALQESGGKQFVYIQGETSQADDGQTMVIGERREVETGISDGTNVEVTSGLSQGEVVVYTEAISEDNPFAAFMMGGGMGGGRATSVQGEPPEGGGTMVQGGGPMGG